MSLSGMMKRAGFAAAGVLLMTGAGTVAARAMPVQDLVPAVQSGPLSGVETVQYGYYRHRDRAYDRWERRRAWHQRERWNRWQHRRNWEYRNRYRYY